MKVTAETITDEQIRELRETVQSGSPLAESCDYALDPPRGVGLDDLDASNDEEREARIEDAREHCASAWNARCGGQS